MRRGIVTSGAALALAGLALPAAPAAAGPVRMCDGTRAVIAKGVGCAEALWLADHARAGEQIAGWSVRGNSAGVVRLRRGGAWVKLRRVPRKSVAALLITGLHLKHVRPAAADGSSGFETMTLCSQGRMEVYAEQQSGYVSPSPGVGLSAMNAMLVKRAWTPTYLVEWRGGRTLELSAHPGSSFSPPGIALTGSRERVRLQLRDDGSGTLTTTGGAWPVTWARGARCRA